MTVFLSWQLIGPASDSDPWMMTLTSRITCSIKHVFHFALVNGPALSNTPSSRGPAGWYISALTMVPHVRCTAGVDQLSSRVLGDWFLPRHTLLLLVARVSAVTRRTFGILGVFIWRMNSVHNFHSEGLDRLCGSSRVMCCCAVSLLFFVVFAYGRCVSALHLDTLNKQRAMLLVRSFMAGKYDEMRPERVSKKVPQSYAAHSSFPPRLHAESHPVGSGSLFVILPYVILFFCTSYICSLYFGAEVCFGRRCREAVHAFPVTTGCDSIAKVPYLLFKRNQSIVSARCSFAAL